MPRRQIAALVDGIYGIGRFEDQYELSRTRTAAEVFRTRRGNCFSFSNLFVAAARTVGLPAYYMDATRAKSVVRYDGSRVVYSRHIVAAVDVDSHTIVVDFSRLGEADSFRYQRLSDRSVTALFINNLGHEALLRQQDGSPFFRAAIALAPDLEAPWNNLAAHYMQQGNLDAAQQILIDAIRHNVESFAPYFNLGLVSLKRGDYSSAESYFKQAYHRKRDNPYLFYNLGLSYLRQGKRDKARWAFKRAQRLDNSLRLVKSKLDLLSGLPRPGFNFYDTFMS